VYGAADGSADVARDAKLEAVYVEQGRDEGEQKEDDEEAEDGDEATVATRVRWRGGGIGVEISLVVVGCGLHAMVGSTLRTDYSSVSGPGGAVIANGRLRKREATHPFAMKP
jgi:hypothetical protein